MTTVAIVADDLIWASRLSDAARRAGVDARRLSGAAAIDAIARADMGCDAAIVDAALMTAEAPAVIAALADAGLPVLVVADHEDVALRKRALAAGAGKVLAYRKLYEDGPAVVAAWLAAVPATTP